MRARRDMDTALEKMEQLTGILGDYTTTLRVMNDILHFQASFVGDQGDSFERFTKEVNEHMKEATVRKISSTNTLQITLIQVSTYAISIFLLSSLKSHSFQFLFLHLTT